MSTRSGKRLHGSPQESPVACAPLILQSERKTRNKKQKENVEVGVKKKNNYVSYPADEDTASVTSGTTEEKPKRRTRRNTLKEHNIDVPISDDIDNHIDNKKNVVKTRRGKKIDEVEGALNMESNENTADLATKPNTNGKKKNKKKKNQKKTSIEDAEKMDIEPQIILKKKSGKKKKKSSLTEKQEVEQNGSRMLNMSADSFHSASGSPAKTGGTGDDKANVSTNSVEPEDNLNATFDKTEAANGLTNEYDTDENINTSVKVMEDNPNTTFNKSGDASLIITMEEKTTKTRESIKNSTFDKAEDISRNKDPNITFDKDDIEARNSTFDVESSITRRSSIRGKKSNDSINNLNTTFDRKSKSRVSISKSDTIDRGGSQELNTTFDTEKKDLDKSENDSKKSSLISSDATINVTFDKSNDNSHISITSDESKSDNILNCTPVLIESSVDESHISENNKTPEISEAQPPLTPLKREGTFTKDGPDVTSPKASVSAEKTPVKRKSLPSPGRTPFPFSKSAQKEKSVLNVTRSIEKSLRKSSLGDIGSRQTKVMFCSPVNSTAVVTQIKGRVIKSNLKGSNKSFVFDDSVSEVRPAGRKRSFTHNEVETRAKRKRLADGLQHSVDRLSRPRTVSANAKLAEPETPSQKPTTPSKAKPSRTKLPNFAALHQKQFSRMESLDECQRRRARRARHLLTPTGSVAIIERISPKGTTPQPTPLTEEPVSRQQTPPKSKVPTLASLNPGYTRFGFKLDVDANPFSVTAKKPEVKRQEEKRPNGLSRQTTCLALPSLAGATATRRDVAKQTVMREKSFTEKRDVKRKENRTIIKGVRTNRRFELQMKLRNINA